MNKKRKLSLVCLDWEGCATLPGGGRVPWPTNDLAELQEKVSRMKVPLILVTGRQAPYGEAGLQAIGAFTDVPSVFENGSILYYPKTKQYTFNDALTPEIRSTIAQFRPRAWHWGVTNGLVPELGKEVCISMSPKDGSRLPELMQRFLLEFTDMTTLLDVTHSMSALDITPKGVNKWTGLRQVLTMFNIAPKDVLGIGDARNDYIWLSEIGIPCCPVNADIATKQLVRNRDGYVADGGSTRGVIEILLHFNLT